MKKYDVIIIGAGPGGIFSAYELLKNNENLEIAIFEEGHALEKRKCPIDGKKIKSCIHCKSCSIMSGFGGAGAFSDGKYNITNDFGGTLYEYIGKEKALELMQYVDEINMEYQTVFNSRNEIQKTLSAEPSATFECIRKTFGNRCQLHCAAEYVCMAQRPGRFLF